MSIRLRLTVLYSTILALTLIAFSVALYAILSRSTLSFLEQTLADEAQRLVDSKLFRLDHIDYPARQFAAPETYVQTLNYSGEIVDRSVNLEDWVLPRSDVGLQACRKGQSWAEVTPTRWGGLFTFYKPVWGQGRVIGVVQLARSLADYSQSLETLRGMLIAGTSLVTVAAFGIGWWLAGAALRPIKQITQTARAIGSERDFNRRVDHAGPSDEVGQLATTFNEMLTELQAAYRQVEQTLQAQRRFVADASHELRTPLTTIRGNLELLQRDPPISCEDRTAVLTDMVDECERLIRLVNNLLVLERADAGRALSLEPVSIKPLIEDVCRQAKVLPLGGRIQCDNLLDVLILGNRDGLKQVLLSLLDNALEHTPEHGKVTVEAALVDDGVAINVRDAGSGIDAAVLPHIFDRFYRGDRARTGAGVGLGLAIAKALVEAQNGTLTVESEVGQGSLFTVVLPQFRRSSLVGPSGERK